MKTESRRRVTVVMGDDLIKKLRLKQSKQIRQKNHSTSFSEIVNSELRKYFK